MISNSSDSESYKSLSDPDDIKSSPEEATSNDVADVTNTRRTKFSRGEKKARRMLIKQGSKPLANVSRVVMRQAHMLFVIDEPEIYKNPKSDTFIVFGEVKIEDLSKQQEEITASNQLKAAATFTKSTAVCTDKPKIEEVEDDAAIDDTGIDAKDIELVMLQAGTTRAKAIRALKENNNDIVNTIMALTM